MTARKKVPDPIPYEEIKRQQSRGASRGLKNGPKRTTAPVRIWIDPYLKETMEALALLGRRSLTTEICIAIEKHLSDMGMWPPPPTHTEIKG